MARPKKIRPPKLTKDSDGRWAVIIHEDFVIPESRTIKVRTHSGACYMCHLLEREPHHVNETHPGYRLYLIETDWVKVPDADDCKGCSKPVADEDNSILVTATTPNFEGHAGYAYKPMVDVQTFRYCANCAIVYGDALAALGFEPRWLQAWKDRKKAEDEK